MTDNVRRSHDALLRHRLPISNMRMACLVNLQSSQQARRNGLFCSFPGALQIVGFADSPDWQLLAPGDDQPMMV